MAKSGYKQPTTLDEAVKVMTPVVKKFARKYTRNHYHIYEDLMQDGYMGICEAWEKFDHSKGASFTTYAWFYIRKKIQNTVDPFWKWDNTTVPEEWAPDSGYEHSMDAFHALQEYSKLNDYEQSLVRMRTEGYTFDEIAKEINSQPGAKRKSLNNIRDEIMDINERLSSEMDI